MKPLRLMQMKEEDRERWYQPYRDLLQGRISCWTFGGRIASPDEAWIAWLSWAIIPDKQMCRCGRHMFAEEDECGIGFRWRCPDRNCRNARSARHGTFFGRAKICPLKAGRLLYHFLVQHKLTEAADNVDLPKRTAIDWYSFFREVTDVAQDHDYRPIGGSHDVVEVDETWLFTRKYHRGRKLSLGKRQTWVFGAISRLTGDMWAERIRDKRAATFDAIMRERIAPRTWIMSDQHRSYQGCAARLGMKGHSSVNHRMQFVGNSVLVRGVAPRLGHSIPGNATARDIVVHTNTIERQWRELKKALRTCRSPRRVPPYIGEFLYRRNVLRHLPTSGQKFARILEDIRRIYPGHTGYAKRVQRPGECACVTCRPPQVRRRNRPI